MKKWYPSTSKKLNVLWAVIMSHGGSAALLWCELGQWEAMHVEEAGLWYICTSAQLSCESPTAIKMKSV